MKSFDWICFSNWFIYDTGHEPDADLGPLISPQAKDRVCELIQSGVDQGAQLLLDGRNVKVPGYENGNFVGPTILHKVNVSFDEKWLFIVHLQTHRFIKCMWKYESVTVPKPLIFWSFCCFDIYQVSLWLN